MNEEEWEAIYWHGLWLEGYLQKIWQAVPAPAVIEPSLKKSALAQIAPELIAAAPPVEPERLTDSVYLRQCIKQIEDYWQGIDGEQYGLRYSAYYLPQWKTEVQIELRTGDWSFQTGSSRPAPIEVIYLGEQLRWLSQHCRKHGHYPGIKPWSDPAALRQAAWESWVEEVRRHPEQTRRRGYELLRSLLRPEDSRVEPAVHIEDPLKESALRYVCPQAAADLPKEAEARQQALQTLDEEHYGLEFVDVTIPSYGLRMCMELCSGYFTAELAPNADDCTRQWLNNLVCLRGYTAEEAANDDHILLSYAAARRDLLWKEEQLW